MTTMTEQTPQTLRSLIISKLIELSTKTTQKCDDQYKKLLRELKTPIERRIKLRDAVTEHTGDDGSTNRWMNILSIALDDPQLADDTMLPMAAGCMVVATAPLKHYSKFPVNQPGLVYSSGPAGIFVADLPGTYTAQCSARDAIRYATTQEIEKYFQGIGTTALSSIMSGNWWSEAKTFIEGQPVFQPPIED